MSMHTNDFSTPSQRGNGTSSSSSSSSANLSKEYQNDRFIPNRSAMDMEVVNYSLNKENGGGEVMSPNKAQYQSNLAQSIFEGKQGAACGSKILTFKNKAPAPAETYQNQQRILFHQQKRAAQQLAATTRSLPTAPFKMLDAPEMLDDFYLNVLDWSKSNLLAVALSQQLYLWNAESGEITEFMKTPEPDNFITAVHWLDERRVAVGTHNGFVQIWDVEKNKRLRTMDGHSARVGSLSSHGHILSSGSRDETIVQHDVRIKQHQLTTLTAHTQEVCGLRWNASGTQLASGANDNQVMIWDAATSLSGDRPAPRFRLTEHCAAVKALAWCPWQADILASGGGTSDRTLRFWNTTTGQCVQSVDTRSQVSSIVWSKTQRELITGHGYAQNQLIVWKYPTLTPVGELRGHTARVLHLAVSPNGESVCSAAADETLQFWNVWDPAPSQQGYSNTVAEKQMSTSAVSLSSATQVRRTLR